MNHFSPRQIQKGASELDQKQLDKQLVRLIWPQQWWILVQAAFCAVGVSVTSLSLPILLKYVLIALTHKNRQLLTEITLGFVGLYIARWPLVYQQSVLFAEIGQRVAQTLRVRMYSHLQTLSLAYFDNQRTGNLLSSFSNDVPIIQSGIVSLKDVIGAPILAIFGLGAAFWLSRQLFFVTIILLPIMGGMMNIITKKIRGISVDTQAKLAEVTTVTEETLAGARLVRAFGAEGREVARFSGSVQAAKDLAITGVKRAALLSPTIDLLGSLGIAVALFVGGIAVVKGTLTFYNLGAFCLMLDRVRNGVSGIGSIITSWKQTQGAAERIFGGILEVPAAVVDMPGAKPLELAQGEIEFKRVSFGYLKQQVVLDNINFTMRPGEVTAVVGPSGAGKSTLADLIPRFYDATQGTISIDGQEIRNVTVQSLRDSHRYRSAGDIAFRRHGSRQYRLRKAGSEQSRSGKRRPCRKRP